MITPLRVVDESTAPVGAEPVTSRGPRAATVAPSDPVRRWTVATLVEAVPGTTRRIWLTDLIPSLVGAGALRKVGRGWLGRVSMIEAVLLGAQPLSSPTNRGRGR